MSRSAVMAEDGRDDYARMTRRELWRALDRAKVSYPSGCTSEEATALLRANKINPRDFLEWEEFRITDDAGNVSIQSHPKRVERIETEADIAKRDAKMAQILERQAKENQEHQEKTDSNISAIESRMDELTKQVTLLTQALLQQKEEPKKKAKETDPAKMKYMAFKKWCKERGHDLQKGEDKEELIKRLGDGQDPS